MMVANAGYRAGSNSYLPPAEAPAEVQLQLEMKVRLHYEVPEYVKIKFVFESADLKSKIGIPRMSDRA